MTLDLNAVDVVENTTMNPSTVADYFDKEKYADLKETILIDQFENLEQLNINLLSTIDSEQIKNQLLLDIIEYVSQNYFSIIPGVGDSDYKIGEMLYEIFIIYTPSYCTKMIMSQFKCNNLEDFQSKIFKQCVKTNNWDYFKNGIIKHIKTIIELLNKLIKIDPKLKKDLYYQKLVNINLYFVELLEVNEVDKYYQYFMKVANKLFLV